MNLNQTGLVVEGGGMRAAYTSGVLEAFLDNHIEFPYIVGVSAGSTTSMSYLSKQKERNKRIYTEWVTDRRFMGFGNLLREGSYFGMKFLFHSIPFELDPFDYDTFLKYSGVLKVCATHCKTGKATYFEPMLEKNITDTNTVLKASSSLPLISPIVKVRGESYLDGGLVDSIPIQKSIEDGNKRHVVILTRNAGYVKKYSKGSYLISKLFLAKYPKIARCIKTRHEVYNKTLLEIETLEKSGLVYVFRPEQPLKIDRYEKDRSKLLELYQQGYEETTAKLSDFKNWTDKALS